MSWRNDQVSERETAKIIELAYRALDVPGDFVELGCYKGDTSLMLADVVRGSEKRLWLYDSFEGLPEKSEKDNSMMGINFRKGALFTTKRELKTRFLKAGMKLPIIKKAWFEELSNKDLPNKIAFVFLDGDLYWSIRVGLALVEEKMTDGGIIIVHDYNNPALPGVAKAVDEWMKQQGLTFTIFESLAIISTRVL